MQFVIDVGLTLIYICVFLMLPVWSWRFWMMYVNQKFLDKFNGDCILLEIKLPREIHKSPFATEVAISSLLQTGGVANWYGKTFDGNLPAFSSLEIASIEGVIHFYVRINKKFRALVEANFYAQYPGIEIVEADDYTKKIRYHHLSKDVNTWSAYYKLGKKWKPTNPKTGKEYSKSGGKEPKDDKDKYEMPSDFSMIKTYVDFGLDKDPKEEFKIDPITPLLEFMGSIKKGEHFWYQILIQDESVYDGRRMPKFYVNEQTHEHVSLSEMAKDRKTQIRTSHFIKPGDKVIGDYGEVRQKTVGKDAEGNEIKKDILYEFEEMKPVPRKEMDIPFEEKEELEAINKKISKPLALVVLRLVYVTKRENFDVKQIQNILSFPKIFKGSNFLSPNVSDPYDFAWERLGGKRVDWRSEEIFDEYVEREGFFPHVGERKGLDKFEDKWFYHYPTKSRKVFRMIYEAILHPFDHPQAEQVSIMNLEEIATLWHLPGQVAMTPTIPRIDSVKGSAPANLPI
ncbi:MAG: hypothetical protein KBC41_03985 [Candidatus Pacebacteria bacterium]|nr:hypothetical protein [Candidatus Paceibacterota bacterium]